MLQVTGEGCFGDTLRWEGALGYPVGDAQQPVGKVTLKLFKTVLGTKKERTVASGEDVQVTGRPKTQPRGVHTDPFTGATKMPAWVS